MASHYLGPVYQFQHVIEDKRKQDAIGYLREKNQLDQRHVRNQYHARAEGDERRIERIED